jgi:Nucleosome binding factor SPN, SPT16 subunit
MQFDETGNRRRKHRYGDEEEFEAEQEERRRRAALDREFKAFAEKISDSGKDEGVDVDIPFREIGFNGVPNRSNVLIQPTTDALVQLTEPPFLVITLNEIEIAHLERVQVSSHISMTYGQGRLLTLPGSLDSKTSTWSSFSRISTGLRCISIPFLWSHWRA